MTNVLRVGLGVLLSTLVCADGGWTRQQATIRFNSEAPLSPQAVQPGELDAYDAILDEPAADRRLVEVNRFLVDYPSSEFLHLALRARWEIRIEQGDWDAIIDAAEEGLEAEYFFRNAKLGFISGDRLDVPGLDEFLYTFAHQEATYYQSIVEAYKALDDFPKMVEYGELGLAAAAEAWSLYDGIAPEGTPEYQSELELNREIQAIILFSLVEGYERDNDVMKVIEYGERILELTPDDLQTLMATSRMMAETLPVDDADRASQLERAWAYAENALTQLDVYFSGANATSFDGGRKAILTGQVQSTLGLIHLQREDWGRASEAWRASIAAAPDEPTSYFMLGLASRQLGDVDAFLSAYARAVYLGIPQPEVRSDLEMIYEARYGSRDGLDEFIEREGGQIEIDEYIAGSPERTAYIEALIANIDVLPTVFPPNRFCYQYYEFLASQDLGWAEDALEIGVGSGVNSLMILDQGVGRLVGTDINENAVTTFEQNASKFGYADQVDVRLVPLDRPEAFSVIDDDERFDLIISNPPWEASTEPKRIAEYAYLDSGWVLLRSMLEGLSDHLKEDGKVWLLYGDPKLTPSPVPPAVEIIMQEAPENNLDAQVLYSNARCSIIEIVVND